MCDSLEEGGRRCPCDAPEARAARRRAKAAAQDAPEGGIGAGGGAPVNADHDHPLLRQWNVAQFNAFAADISAATGHTPELGPDGALLSEEQMRGKTDRLGFAYTDEETDAQAAYLRLGGTRESLERAVITAGEAVAREAERRSGVTPAQAASDAEQEVADAIRERDEAQAAWDAARAEDEQSQEYLDAVAASKNAEKRGTKNSERLADRAWRLAYDSPSNQAAVAAGDATRAADKKLASVMSGLGEKNRENLGALAKGYREVLAEVRPMGGEGKVVAVDRHSEQAAKSVENAMKYFPTDWVERHNGLCSGVGSEMRVSLGGTGTGGWYKWFAPSKGKKETPVVDRNKVGSMVEEVESPEVSFSRSRMDRSEAAAMASMLEEMREDFPEEKYNARMEHLRNSVTEGVQIVRHYDVRVVDGNGEYLSGMGWERYEGPGTTTEEGKTTWRRPKVETEHNATLSTPTIKTSVRRNVITGKERSFLAVSVHETAHRFEHIVPGIRALEGTFHKRRTTGADGKPLEVQSVTGTAEGTEETFGLQPDSFADAYTSRKYDIIDTYEIMSTGTEHLFSGSAGGLVGAGKFSADLDHRAFVLGVMATVGRKGGQG